MIAPPELVTVLPGNTEDKILLLQVLRNNLLQLVPAASPERLRDFAQEQLTDRHDTVST